MASTKAFVKQKSVNFTIPDDNPQLIKRIGAKPNANDPQYNSKVTIANIVCQDCSQGMGQISSSDSQSQLAQLNACVANLGEGSSGTANIKTITQKPETEQTKETNVSYTGYYIGGGIGSCFIMILIGIIIFLVLRK